MEKATFRLPEWELASMRDRSRRQRRSLNAVAAEVIALGLGHAAAPAHSTLAALGPLLVRPALTGYVPPPPPSKPVDLTGALDWSRGER